MLIDFLVTWIEPDAKQLDVKEKEEDMKIEDKVGVFEKKIVFRLSRRHQ